MHIVFYKLLFYSAVYHLTRYGKEGKIQPVPEQDQGRVKTKTKMKTLKLSLWPNALQEILYRPTSYNPHYERNMSPSYERVSWKVTPCTLTQSGLKLKRVTPMKYSKTKSPSIATRTLMGEKSVYCVRLANCKKISFSPIKSTNRSTLKSPYQKNSQSKRLYNRSPCKGLAVVRVTPSKSPAPKKVKRSLVSYYGNELKLENESNPQDKYMHNDRDSTNNLNSVLPLNQTHNCSDSKEEFYCINEPSSIHTEARLSLAINDTEMHVPEVTSSCVDNNCHSTV